MIYQSAVYMFNMHVIVVLIKINMDTYMCGINFFITIELTATSPAEWLLAQPHYVVSTSAYLCTYVHIVMYLCS